jgi:uncharacterized protein YbjT (DUF2867 family)
MEGSISRSQPSTAAAPPTGNRRPQEPNVIVLSAATSELGRLVVDDLLHRVPPDDVAVAVRSPATAAQLAAAGVAVRSADYTDPGSLRTAFAGADRLLFISSSDVESVTRVHQHRTVVDVAVGAGSERSRTPAGSGRRRGRERPGPR